MSVLALRLRDVTPGDFPALFAMYTDSRSAHMAAFSGDDPDDEPKFQRRWRRILTSPDVVVKAIEVDGRLCGTVSAWPEGHALYVAYWVDSAWWGQGIATRALRCLLQDCARPVRARCAADNVASARVLAKCGFHRVGRVHGFANMRGQVIEEFVYELAASDVAPVLPTHFEEGLTDLPE